MVKVINHNGVLMYLVQSDVDLTTLIHPSFLYKDKLYLTQMSFYAATRLKELGFELKGMEPFRYAKHLLVSGQYPLMPHQVETAAFVSMHKRCMVFNQQRTGKTPSTISAVHYLQQQGVVKGVLVISPLTLVELVWQAECNLMVPQVDFTVVRDADPRYMVKTFGNKTKKQKVAQAKKAIEVLRNDRKFYQQRGVQAAWYCTNSDTLRHNEAVCEELGYLLQSGEINMVLLDESTEFGNIEAGRTKGLETLLAKAPYDNLRVVGMTGTPGGPMKLYAQCRLVDPKRCHLNKWQWQNLTMFSVPLGGLSYVAKDGQSKGAKAWKPKPDWAEHIQKYIPPSILFRSSEVLDIAEELEFIRVPMSEEQQVLYNKVKKEAILPYINSDKIKTKMDIEHIMTEMAKLLQISTGTVLTDGGVTAVDYSPRLDAICKLINSTTKKVVIFNTYVETCGRLAQDLEACGFSTVIVTGKVKGKKRTDALSGFQKGGTKTARVLICHPSTVQFGVEAAAADVIIFNGPIQNGALAFEQALKRCSSLKQTSKVVRAYQLSASEIEDKAWDSLHKSVTLEATLLDIVKELM